MDSSRRTTVTTLSGVAIAAAAAGLFITQTVVPAAAADTAKVHCAGVNSCKGKSECKSGNSSCKGQNSCKGQGWLPLDEKTCRAKGGIIDEKG
jgi:hypothetical protein